MPESEAERRAAERLRLAWSAKWTMQRYAGYFAAVCWTIVLLLLNVVRARQLQPGAVRLLLIAFGFALVLSAGIALIRIAPRFWGLVLCILLAPPVVFIALTRSWVWLARGPNPMTDAYRLLREVPDLLEKWPDLPESRRWSK